MLDLLYFSFYDRLLFLVGRDISSYPLECLYLIKDFLLNGLELIFSCWYFLEELVFEWLLRTIGVGCCHNFLIYLFKLVLSDKFSQLLWINGLEVGAFVESLNDFDLLIDFWKLGVFFIFHTVNAARILLHFLQAIGILNEIDIHLGILFI